MGKIINRDIIQDDETNWLSEQLKREARISAWDLDDRAGNSARDHQRNCDARAVAAEHAAVHQAEHSTVYNRKPVRTSQPETSVRIPARRPNAMPSIVLVFFIIWIIMVVVSMISAILF